MEIKLKKFTGKIEIPLGLETEDRAKLLRFQKAIRRHIKRYEEETQNRFNEQLLGIKR